MFNKLKTKITEIDKDFGLQERSENIFAVAALFDTPDGIVKAATKVSSLGYEKYDVHTPYPIHGMDDAMRLKPSKLGFYTFFFGALGTLTALGMIAYMSGYDYKNVIGGKPFFAFPSAMPITFELTVLFGALFTIIVMMVVMNKLPWNNNPLIDTEYMKRVSSDRFGVAIEAIDPKFNKEEIVKLFESLGSCHISLIKKYTFEESEVKTPIFNPRYLALLAVIAIVTAGATYVTLNKVIYIAPFDWMYKQFKLMPQSTNENFSDGYGMRTPVEGTVARGFIPYEFKGMPDSVVKMLANPLPLTPEVLKKGKTMYDTYCSPCHGNYGKGDSRLNGQFPNPPTLHSGKSRNWADGNIFHVITNGQNVMPSYSKQISKDDRWAIIHYFRALQRSQNALDSDIQEQTK